MTLVASDFLPRLNDIIITPVSYIIFAKFLLFATDLLAVVSYRCYFPPFFFWFPPFFSSESCFSLLFPTCLDSIFSFSNSNYVFSDSFLPLFLQFEIKFENELGELPPPLIGPSPHNFSDFHSLTFSNSLATRRRRRFGAN